MTVTQLQDQVGRGEYRVDVHAVADAIVRRLLEGRHLSRPESQPSQSECS